MCIQRTSKLILCPVLILLVVASSGCSREEPGVEIPLNKIWGYKMLGTQSIENLEPKHFGPAVRQLPEQEQIDLLLSSLTQQIDFAIGRRVDEQKNIGPGFAVAGTGHKSLAAVKEALEQDNLPSQAFPLGTEISLFFFTRDSGWPIQLRNVTKSKNSIAVHYYFVPRKSNGMYAKVLNKYFSLIPLSKLPAGSYSVDVVQTTEKKYTARGFQEADKEVGEKLVCKSFVFSVVHDRNETSNSK